VDALSYFGHLLLAALLTSLLICLLIPIARKVRLVDIPHGRKAHSGEIPLVGGIAMVLSLFTLLFAHEALLVAYRPLLAGIFLLLLVGVLDDLHELSTRARLLAQISAAIAMTVWAGVTVDSLGALLGSAPITLGAFAVGFTIFGVVGVINAINMTDGLDGLAGGMILLPVSVLAWLAWNSSQYQAALFLGLVAANLIGFLAFNYRLPRRAHALVFMGDAGSMVLGFIVAWFIVLFSQGEDALITPVQGLWLIAIPLIDTIAVMVRRILKGHSPFSPDREHLHHILLRAGLSVGQAVSLLILLSALFIVWGLWAPLPEWGHFLSFFILFLLYLLATLHAWRFMRFISRLVNLKQIQQ
jgi:UDP-GlcNAc:undecaprenyl-phosphate/decaprenyl-phosphate GlcNAc-1-phosphate transferase